MSAEFNVRLFESGQSQPTTADQLTVVENLLVTTYLPAPALKPDDLELVHATWDERERLIDMLRGKHFFGDFNDITISKLPNPHGELEAQGIRGGVSSILPQDLVGFSIEAAVDSALATSGRLQRSVWIVRRSSTTAAHSGVLWRRFVGNNRGDIDLEQLHKNSMQRGLMYRHGRPNDGEKRSRLNYSDA